MVARAARRVAVEAELGKALQYALGGWEALTRSDRGGEPAEADAGRRMAAAALSRAVRPRP